MNRNRANLAALFAAVGWSLLTAPAFGQDPANAPSCRTVENCLCGPAGDPSGVYIGRVGFGSTSSGIEVSIEQVLVDDENDPTQPNTIVVRHDGVTNGDRILFSNRGYLIERGGAWACPAGTPGQGLRISTNDARTLMRATSCFRELSTITIGGQYPPCSNDPASGGVLCAHAPAQAMWPALLALLGLAAGRRRRPRGA